MSRRVQAVTLWKIATARSHRIALGETTEMPTKVLPADSHVDLVWVSPDALDSLDPDSLEDLDGPVELLAPIEDQEVWASGVTYEESRYAREHESVAPDFYRNVYHADRPELFLKALGRSVVGPGEPIGIRADSEWNVPEPELCIVVNPLGEIVALTLGNDVSSRSIEGANPLYLPQAKVYDRSCAIGPCLVPIDEAPPIDEIVIRMDIKRSDSVVFAGASPLSRLRRQPKELVDWLTRARSFPQGAILLTGTGIVPPNDFTLLPSDVVTIHAEGLGSLSNPVELIGRAGSLSGGER